MMKDVLAQLGLTDSEQKVYLALIELGDSTRGGIVNKSGVAGSKVYELLEKLKEKGLVSVYFREKIKHFKPAHPNQIVAYIEKKKQELLLTEKEAKNMLPALIDKYAFSKEEQEVELFTGLQGLETIFREQVEIMDKGETCYVIGGTRGSDETAVQAFFEKIHLMREEKKIKTKMLFNAAQQKTTEQLYSTKKYSGTQTRYISHTSPVAINVYKDRTVIILFGKNISAIHIKSKEIANSFLEYFDMLWKIAKK